MKKDKKAAAVGDLSLILLERIGQAFVKRDVKECEVVSL
jgi:3-dehydroquinate synthetase